MSGVYLPGTPSGASRCPYNIMRNLSPSPQSQFCRAGQGINFNFKIASARYLSDRLPLRPSSAADEHTLYLSDAE